MPHSFTWLDWAVLIGYLVGITVFGLWIARKTRSSQGYFLGDRQLPWWIMIGQAFGTGTHAEQPVAQAGATFGAGFATIWYQWKNLLITPFYWLLSPWYRRSKRTTVGEIVEDRYGRGLALAYTVFAIAFFVFNQGAMLKGAAKIVSIATGNAISPNAVVLAMTVTFILYSFFGGLVASAYADFVQGFLIIIMSVMLIPLGLREVGGFAGMRQALPPGFFQLYGKASGLDAFTIAMLTVNGIVGITAQPHMVSQAATGNTERAGRVGMTYGSMVKRFCTIGWALTGLVAAAMVVRRGVTLPESEAAFGYASRELLGSGLTGLMVACVLAANMSTCSNFMVNTGALFTRNIYRPYIQPHADDRTMLRVGQVSALGLTVLGIGFALQVEKVLDAFMFTETLAAFVGIMFLGGLLWRRANRYGAWAATLASLSVYYAMNYRAAGSLRLVYKWAAWPFAMAMLAGFVALVVVSLITPAEDQGRVAAFFTKMSRSTDGEAAPGEGKGGPAAARGQDLLFLDLPGWLNASRRRGFFQRYREDLVGFALAWLAVAAMVATAWGVLQIGRAG